MARMTPLRIPTALLLIPLLAGCFEYVPVTPERARPGAPVRVELTDEGERRLDEETGHRRSVVEGTLIRKDASSWVISSPLPDNPEAYVGRDLESRITVRLEEVSGVGARRLDRVKSALLGGVVAAAVVTAVGLIFEGDPGGEGEPPPGPTPPGEGSVVPLTGSGPPG